MKAKTLMKAVGTVRGRLALPSVAMPPIYSRIITA